MGQRSILFVHGGVSGGARIKPATLHPAVEAGAGEARALDAVEAAIVVLEDEPALNAGFGAVLNRDGGLELDAGIADGASGRCGAVGNATVRHPISLARRVLEETPHVLVTGAGTEALAGDMERLPDTTASQRARWSEAAASGALAFDAYGSPGTVDTVGAVALDRSGRLAAGSSTGGVFGQMSGRVGDAAVFGAGFYASRRAAVVGTGLGELFIETLACREAARAIERGAAPQAACEATIELLGQTSAAAAGLLAADDRGRVGASYRGATWAVEGPDGPLEAVRVE